MPKSVFVGESEDRTKKHLKVASSQKKSSERRVKSKSVLEEKLKAKQMIQLAVQKDTLDDGKRKISKKIDKNRGLTKHTKKEWKNPRVKLKLKYAKAESKHKQLAKKSTGAHPPVEAYDGEKTGINDRVIKSVSLSHR